MSDAHYEQLNAIERVKLALAKHVAGHPFEVRPADVAALVEAHIASRGDAAAEIERLKHDIERHVEIASSLASRDDWQPIESAPRDGTKIDLWTAYGRFTDCIWVKNKSAWCFWGTNGFEAPGWERVEGVPTHWREKPQPPTHEQQAPGSDK